MTENQETLAKKPDTGKTWLCVKGPQTVEHLKTLKNKWKRINKHNTKGGDMGTEGWRSMTGQLRLPQHPATVDLKYGRLCVVVLLGKGCLMCRCHGNYGHNAGTHFLRTTLLDPLICPAALSTHLRRHDRSCCYFWLLFAISVVFFCCTFCVLLFVFFPSSTSCRLATEAWV